MSFFKRGLFISVFLSGVFTLFVTYQNFTTLDNTERNFDTEDTSLAVSEDTEGDVGVDVSLATGKTQCINLAVANGYRQVTPAQVASGIAVNANEKLYVDGPAVVRADGVIITGVNRNSSKLMFCVPGTASAIRVLAQNVTIKDLDVQVFVYSPLRKSDGTGDLGAGVVLGRFLDTSSSFREVRARLERLTITRIGGSKASGITLIGNVGNTKINDIQFRGRFGHTLLMHWGGQVDAAYASECAAITSPMVFMTDVEATAMNERFRTQYGRAPQHPWFKGTLKCPVRKTWHVHDVIVSNIKHDQSTSKATLAGYLVTLSAVYNVTVTGVEGVATEPILVFNGDEGERYAIPEQKPLIMSNIRVSHVKATAYHILPTPPAELKYPSAAVLLGARGGTKFKHLNQGDLPFELTYTDMKNVRVTDFEFSAFANGTPFNGEVGRNWQNEFETFFWRGVWLGYARGDEIYVKNIQLNNMGKKHTLSATGLLKNTVGVEITGASNVGIINVQAQTRTGINMLNSRAIRVYDSKFYNDLYEPIDPSKPNAFGIVVKDFGSPTVPPHHFLNSITLNNSKFVGHRYAVSMPNQGLDRDLYTPLCDRLRFTNLTRLRAKERQFFAESCNVNGAFVDTDLFIFAGQSNAMGAASSAGYPVTEGYGPLLVPNVKVWLNLENFRDGVGSPVYFPLVDIFTFDDFKIGENSIQLPSDRAYVGNHRTNFGPESRFAQIWSQANPTRKMLMIKYAKGATALVHDEEHWDPFFSGDNLYDGLLYNINVAKMNARTEGQLRCFVWIQGEYERRLWAKGSTATRTALTTEYMKNFREMIRGVRAKSETPNARVAIVQLSAANRNSDISAAEFDALLGTANDPIQQQLSLATDAFQAMQWTLANDPGVLVVNTQGLQKDNDNIHYSGSGLIELGERIHEACYRGVAPL